MKNIALLIFLLCVPGFNYAMESIENDIVSIEQDIANAREDVNAELGVISEIAAVRLETLLLSKALLERELLIKKGKNIDLITIEVAQPDEEKVASILQDIESTLQEIVSVESELGSSGGLQEVLIRTQLETEKISLAQLKLAYYQAHYGILFSAPSDTSVSSKETELITGLNREVELPEWADPEYPQINYEMDMFRYANQQNMSISGWWITDESRAEIDDSPKVVSRNLSEYQENSYGDQKYLLYQCVEGQTSVVYLTGEFMIAEYDRNSFNVSVRIDSDNVKNEDWAELTNNKGAGIFGRRAEQLLRDLYDSRKLFLRLQAREKNIDASFNLAGQNEVIEKLAAACGWTLEELTKKDYIEIQSLLEVAGFYKGKVDGIWGNGSKKSLREFQKSAGLNPTGAPNKVTLDQLGFSRY